MPPSPVTRRRILQTACGSLVALFAGCSSVGSPTEQTTVDSPTETNSPSSSSPRLSFLVEITQQPSDASPPKFQASLTNEGPHSVTVTYGADLLWSVDAEYPDALRVFPTHLVDENLTVTPADHCWEYPEHPAIPIPAMESVTDLPPGEIIAQEFVLYNDAEDTCYPAGEHSIRNEIEVIGIQGAINLVVQITIDETGQFSIEGTPARITA